MISGAKFVISQRYHGALFSLACVKPTIAISSDPKVVSMSRDFGTLPAKPNEILTNLGEMVLEIERAIDYWKENGVEVAKKIELRSYLTRRSIKNILKKSIFPIDKDEQMFYNVKKDTERKENDKKRQKKRDNSSI